MSRRANCTYNALYDIPNSNCTNPSHAQSYLLTKLTTAEVRGVCEPVLGVCTCLQGYTGRADWINLDGIDCHDTLSTTRRIAILCLISSIMVHLQALRLICKTYINSKKKDQTLKKQLEKPPNQIALNQLVCFFPTTLNALTKLTKPDALMVDPSANPAFFVLTFLCLGAEFAAYTVFVRSLLLSLTTGLHKQSDRNTVLMFEKIMVVAKKVPFVDMFIRTFCIIIPALIGAATNNANNITIITFFFYKFYGYFKYVTYVSVYGWSVHKALIITEPEERNFSSLTGSTAELKLRLFRKKIRGVLVILCVVICLLVYIAFSTTLGVQPINVSYGFAQAFLRQRFFAGLMNFGGVYVLYFDDVMNVLKWINKALANKENLPRGITFERKTGTAEKTGTGEKPDGKSGHDKNVASNKEVKTTTDNEDGNFEFVVDNPMGSLSAPSLNDKL